MRSRTDCIMVLPVRNSRVKNTAPRIARSTKPMSPSCLMKAIVEVDCAGWVLVSLGEFANKASMRAEIAADCDGSPHAPRTSPPCPCRSCGPRRTNHNGTGEWWPVLWLGWGPWRRKLPTMSKVQSSEPLPFSGPDGRMQRHLVADFPAELFHQRRVHQRTGTGVAVSLHLLVADHEFALVQVEIAVGVDGERENEVLLLLVVAAEPSSST